MEHDQIINLFFKYGCNLPGGERLPLKNCEHIRRLYQRDIRHFQCCGPRQDEIHKLYRARLKKFLQIENASQ